MHVNDTAVIIETIGYSYKSKADSRMKILNSVQMKILEWIE